MAISKAVTQNKIPRDVIACMAEYIVLAMRTRPDSPPENFHRVNQLAIELFMLLPADIYRLLARGLIKDTKYLLDALTQIRSVNGLDLLKHDELISHASDISIPVANSKN